MRGRRLTAIIAAGLLALAAAGCGGGDAAAPEVPGPPADVALPEATVAPTSESDSSDSTGNDDSTATDEGTTDESTTPEDTGTTDDTGTATPDSSGGGTAAPDTQADSPTNDTPPPADSEAEQFEDFCAQNPGAC
jgi:hypothetical protein